MNKFFIFALSIIGCVVTINPTFASGDYYVNPSSGAALDTNTCRSGDDPCATVTGALAVISASANPADSTIHLSGTVTETISISDEDLHGLTIVGGKGDARPTIDATGESYGMYVNGVDDVTIKQVKIVSPQEYGIYAFGTTDSHLEGITIDNVYVSNFTGVASSQTGIALVYADNAVVKHSRINNITPAYTDEADVSYSLSVSGITVNRGNHVKLLHNQIENITATYTATAVDSMPYVYAYGFNLYDVNDIRIGSNSVKSVAATANTRIDTGYGVVYSYGLYGYYVTNGRVQNNTIAGVSGVGASTIDGTGNYSYVYAMYLGQLNTVTVEKNAMRSISSSTQVEDTELSYTTTYGIYATIADQVTVSKNTIKNSTAQNLSGNGEAAMYSYFITNSDNLDVQRNLSNNTNATAVNGTASAKNVALYLSDTPEVNVFHNRFANFKSTGTTEETSTSIGIDGHYNSSADLLNNLIYFTESPAAAKTVVGLLISSQQATPVRVLHNTLSNMMTCFELKDMKVVEVKNTICRLSTSGANVYEVNSDDYDMTGLTSNGNSYYTTVGALSFVDNDTGTMTFADWKAAYGVDKKSIAKNPRLNLSNPSKKEYLHLKKDSPLIDAGLAAAEFKGDAVMNQRLTLDWDGQNRPNASVKSDIGADEFYP